MGAAPGAGWEEGEFDFKLVFEEEPQQRSQGPSPARTTEPPGSMPAEDGEGALLLQLEPVESSGGGGGGGTLGQSHFHGARARSGDSSARDRSRNPAGRGPALAFACRCVGAHARILSAPHFRTVCACVSVRASCVREVPDSNVFLISCACEWS